jgi:hypothetical protein
MQKVLMVDPPEGWKYGFPKPMHEEYFTLKEDFDFNRWLVSEGYPQSIIDSFPNKEIPYRCWWSEIEE